MTKTKFQAPEGATFRVGGIRKFALPHPYCITPKHIAVAADLHCGLMNDKAIADAEKRGAKCGVRGCRLPWDEHKSQVTLIVILANDAPRDLNQVAGLGPWLTSIKDEATAQGIQGFAFPRERQYKETDDGC